MNLTFCKGATVVVMARFELEQCLAALEKYRVTYAFEALLLTHPCVADAAVIPIADEEAGQVPKAFVVLRTETTPEDIHAYVAARVAPYKKLRFLEVIDAIPKSPSGKILRRVLAARA